MGLLAGVALAMMAVAAVQVGLVAAGVTAGGFRLHGSPGGVLLASSILAFCAVGSGLLVASFTTNDSQAGNVGGAVMMLQVFLSGAFFPMPAATLWTFSGHELGAWDALPATHCLLALQSIVSEGLGIRDVAFRLCAAAATSFAIFAAGVALFHFRHMRASR